MTECAYQQGFGGWMRQQREQLGLKQPEIARRMAVSTNTVRNWEHGRTSMSGFQERQIRHMFRMEREAQMAAAAEFDKVAKRVAETQKRKQALV